MFALETIDLAKVSFYYFTCPPMSILRVVWDPYILRNSSYFGSHECRFCLTLHTNEGSYLAHTQGKNHQTSRCQARTVDDCSDSKQCTTQSVPQNRTPRLSSDKVQDEDTGKECMMVQAHLSKIKAVVIPRRRPMSAWKQKREPPNKAYQ
jgi:splicing factor 3A subunit 2